MNYEIGKDTQGCGQDVCFYLGCLMENEMKLYYSEMTINQDNDSWSIHTTRTINLETNAYFLRFCDYIFELLSEQISLLTYIDKQKFDENILEEILYKSDLEIHASEISDADDVKTIRFECENKKIYIKIYPPYKVTLEVICMGAPF